MTTDHIANVAPIVTRESPYTPAEALLVAMAHTHPGTSMDDAVAVLTLLPYGWGLVDARAVAVAGYELLERLGDVEPGIMAGRHR